MAAKTIMCDVSNNGQHNKGPLFEFRRETFKEFEELVDNICPNSFDKVVIPNTLISVKFSDGRRETYTLEIYPKKMEPRPLVEKYIDKIIAYINKQEQLNKEDLIHFMYNLMD